MVHNHLIELKTWQYPFTIRMFVHSFQSTGTKIYTLRTAVSCQPPLPTMFSHNSAVSSFEQQSSIASLPPGNEIVQDTYGVFVDEPNNVLQPLRWSNSIDSPVGTTLGNNLAFTPYPGYVPPPPPPPPPPPLPVQNAAKKSPSLDGAMLFAPPQGLDNSIVSPSHYEERKIHRLDPTSPFTQMGTLSSPSYYAALAELSGRSAKSQPENNFVYAFTPQPIIYTESPGVTVEVIHPRSSMFEIDIVAMNMSQTTIVVLDNINYNAEFCENSQETVSAQGIGFN
ncbi:unnamed protein product [Angiostrongylus costaricensis]|uniref:DUF1421 domain-containing protein n=1 Tax=Angiostrongylus costaricensis TaxID=334426 RepID=A0A158PH75_ANGCS|nr:unnamed protein product [Angiostrongylus costaricensis]